LTPSSDWKVAGEAKLADGVSLGAARTDNEELPKREAAICNLEVPHEIATLDLLLIRLRYDMITSEHLIRRIQVHCGFPSRNLGELITENQVGER
jgi:hypothetical protein